MVKITKRPQAPQALADDALTMQTADLLGKIYNGTTDQKKYESVHLRNKIAECLRSFYQHINKPEEYATFIEEEIARSSEFAAFKRKIIRDDAELSAKFATALN